ncbi:MAG: hypothetical protein ACE37D_21260 [Pseudomonadales bacterium]
MMFVIQNVIDYLEADNAHCPRCEIEILPDVDRCESCKHLFDFYEMKSIREEVLVNRAYRKALVKKYSIRWALAILALSYLIAFLFNL